MQRRQTSLLLCLAVDADRKLTYLWAPRDPKLTQVLYGSARKFNAFNARSDTTSAFTPPVHEPVALEPDRTFAAAAGGGRQPRLWHGAAGFQAVLLCAGMACAVLWYSELR